MAREIFHVICVTKLFPGKVGHSVGKHFNALSMVPILLPWLVGGV